jgi:alkanesulfonate monooxygenase SsuD/methylene tetrahydromethanopterin reductase-like flavin-dependent oxidoreductase (luciferase family)
LFGDHYFGFAPLTGMAAAALATTTLRVGTTVLANDFWHPAMLAREALASTWFQTAAGIRHRLGLVCRITPKPASHLRPPGVHQPSEESLQILKGLLSGETVTFQGKYYHIDQLTWRSRCSSPTAHPDRGGSQRVLSLAARQADIISFDIRNTPGGDGFDTTSISTEATRQKVEWVCQAAGERLPGLEFSIVPHGAAVSGNQEQAARQITEFWKQWGIEYTLEQVLESPAFLVGDVEQIVDKLQQNREQFGFSYCVFGGDA